MKNIITILISLIFFGCQEHGETKIKTLKSKKDSFSREELNNIIYSKNDTFLIFDGNSEGYGVFRWGVVNQFQNIGRDSLYLDSIDRDIIKLKNSFVYTNGCGSACTYSLIMPIEKNREAIIAMYPLIKDKEAGYLVAKGDDEKVLLSIIDLTNSKVENISGEFDKTRIPPNLAIDTVYIGNSRLCFRWHKDKSELGFKEIELNRN